MSTVIPVNSSPTATNDVLNANRDTALAFDKAFLLANDSDPDGDTLTITGFSQASNGTVADNGNGTYSYTPSAGFTGSDSFSYTVDDGNGNTSTATVAINVTAANTTPTASNDTLNSKKNQSKTFNSTDLLGNDSDVDGDTLTITGFSQPSNGTLVDNGNGSYTYNPNAGFTGTDSFNYTVDDGNGGTATATVNITVDDTNTDPNAQNDSLNASAGSALTFDAATLLANDTDVDGDSLAITSVSNPTNGTLVDNGNGSYSYNPNAGFTGTDSFSYTVEDGNGGTSTATVDINVASVNSDPNAQNDSLNASAGSALTFDAATLLANDTDVDGDSLAITSVSNPTNGTLVDNGNGSYSYNPNAGFTGTDSFSYTVEDGNGGTSTATVDINVASVNSDPNAQNDSLNASAGSALTFDAATLLANDTDVDGDSLAITSVSNPTNGTLVDNGNGSYSYNPNAGFTGTDSFSYTVEDGNGGTSTATVDINVASVNSDPNAQNDSLNASAGSALTFDAATLLANDTDVDGDSLAITSVSNPTNGTLVDNGNGSYSYNPNAGFTGTDSFSYTVEDGNGGTSTATVDINVASVNSDPNAQNDSLNASAGSALTFDAATLLANDTDVDGDSLAITSVSNPTNGTLVDNGNGSYSYNPNAGFTGTDSFSYTVEDGNGGTSTATVDINVASVNSDPNAQNDSLNASAGSALTFDAATLLANDTDVDGDSLAITSVSNPTNGTLVDNGNGSYSYNPNAGFTGTDSFSYTVEDGNGGTSTATVDINVASVNSDPNAQNDSLNANENTPLTFNASELLANDVDADDDNLRISNITAAANGTVVDNGDGTFTYTADAGYIGSDNFSYTIDDGNGGTSSATVSVTVNNVNDGPNANADTFSGTEDAPLIISAADLLANDSDPDGDTLSITDFGQPDNGSLIDNGDGTYTYNPNANYNGNDTFAYTVSDGNGGTSTANVTLGISNVNDGPVSTNDTYSTDENESLNITVADLLSNDEDIDDDKLTLESITQPTNGTLTDNGDGSYTYNPNTGFSGADSFSYTVTDGNGGTSTANVAVNVNNVNFAPDLTDDTFTSAEDTAFTFSAAELLGNDTDRDGDALTVVNVKQPNNGAIADNGDGTYTFTPDANFNGSVNFEYTVEDGNGGSRTGNVTIDIGGVNDTSTAGTDSFSTDENQSLNIKASKLLSNDTDPDGDTLSITGFSQPTNGTLIDDGNGSYTYNPNAGFFGTDSFTYTISDGQGGTATGTVNINVNDVNVKPTGNDDTLAAVEDTDLVFDPNTLLANDTDGDSDTLSIAGFSQPENGTLTDNGNGTWTYRADANFSGTDSFTYNIDDGHGGKTKANVNVTVGGANDAPTAKDDTLTTDEDSPLTFSAGKLTGNDSDIDGDNLSIQTFGDPANGTVVNNGDGTYTYTPDFNYSGTDTFDYTVTDADGLTSTGTVNITVNNVEDIFDRLPGVRTAVDQMLAQGIITPERHAELMAQLDSVEAAPDLETANALIDEFFATLNEITNEELTKTLLDLLAPPDMGVLDEYVNSMVTQLVMQMSSSLGSFGQATIDKAFEYVEEEEKEKEEKARKGGKFA